MAVEVAMAGIVVMAVALVMEVEVAVAMAGLMAMAISMAVDKKIVQAKHERF